MRFPEGGPERTTAGSGSDTLSGSGTDGGGPAPPRNPAANPGQPEQHGPIHNALSFVNDHTVKIDRNEDCPLFNPNASCQLFSAFDNNPAEAATFTGSLLLGGPIGNVAKLALRGPAGKAATFLGGSVFAPIRTRTVGAVAKARGLLGGLGLAKGGEGAFAAGGRDSVQSCLNSFTADTPVLMADGTKKSISQIRVGDKVMATDPETGRSEARLVTALIRHSGAHRMVAITLGDGTIVHATGHHPFWDQTVGRFVYASYVETGDHLLSANGSSPVISAIRTYSESLTAYNLEVEWTHTYYAGSTPVLVHNSCARDALGRFTSGENVEAATGRGAHEAYENTLGGGSYVFNRRLPGSLKRPDAVDYTQRIVRELKPARPGSIAAGWRQVNGYKAYLEQYTGKQWTAHVDTYSP